MKSCIDTSDHNIFTISPAEICPSFLADVHIFHCMSLLALYKQGDNMGITCKIYIQPLVDTEFSYLVKTICVRSVYA